MSDSAPPQPFRAVLEDGVLKLSGELDLHAVQNVLGRPLVELVDTDNDVILDMSGLSFIDSFGLSELVRIAQRLDGHALVLRNPSDQARKILDLTRLDTLDVIRIE